MYHVGLIEGWHAQTQRGTARYTGGRAWARRPGTAAEEQAQGAGEKRHAAEAQTKLKERQKRAEDEGSEAGVGSRGRPGPRARGTQLLPGQLLKKFH